VKSTVASLLTSLCSRLIYLLHNRNTPPFNRLELQSVRFSYSQFGEDLAISKLVDELGIRNGIYVDAGAFHPVFGSNTLLLHQAGWHGMNIDLAPERIETFKRLRPKDHNVAACLSDSVRNVTIGHYEIPSTDRIVIDTEATESIAGAEPIGFSKLTTTTLTEIIERSPFPLDSVHYLNIDCEGQDLAVLLGLDLDRCRPRIISIEAFSDDERRAITKTLSPCGYHLEIIVPPAMIFVLR
jgi:FkbM family methyltransferase